MLCYSPYPLWAVGFRGAFACFCLADHDHFPGCVGFPDLLDRFIEGEDDDEFISADEWEYIARVMMCTLHVVPI
jgi:hypothetical protein